MAAKWVAVGWEAALPPKGIPKSLARAQVGAAANATTIIKRVHNDAGNRGTGIEPPFEIAIRKT
jgi:hypothetical protein